MTETLTVDDLVYQVRRSDRRKTVGITIDRDGSLVLHAPSDCPWDVIESMGREKSIWVHSKMAEREMLFRPKRQREFVTGESFYYLGRTYRLLIVNSAKEEEDLSRPLLLHEGRFKLQVAEVGNGVRHFRNWYAVHLDPWIKRRVERFAPRVGVEPKRVSVRDLGYRWASCTPAGSLSFHWCVACLPPAFIEYLVIHELAHQITPHHDDRFWSIVGRILPDYRKQQRVLAEKGGRYIGIPVGQGD